MNELLMKIGHYYRYQNDGQVFIGSILVKEDQVRSYWFKYPGMLWCHHFPDAVSLRIRRIHAVQELINAGICSKEQAMAIVGIGSIDD